MDHEPQRKHQKSKQQARVHFQQPLQQSNNNLYSPSNFSTSPNSLDYHRNSSTIFFNTNGSFYNHNNNNNYQHLPIMTQPGLNNCNFF